MKRINIKSLISVKISDKEATDTGLAIVLIFLLLCYFFDNVLYAGLAIPILLISMLYPRLYYYPTIIWLGFSKLLGLISSKIILSIIFYLVVFPMGLTRRMLGKDTLLLNQFKKSKKSVLIVRNYQYTAKDLEKPY